MKVETAISTIVSCTSARDAIEKLGLSRSRLRRLLNSKPYKDEIDNYRLITQTIVTARAGQYAGWMMGNLANLTDGDNEDCSRKACMAALAQAMDGQLRPNSGGRPAQTLLEKISKELVQLVNNPPPTLPNAPMSPLVLLPNNDK